MDDFGHKEQIKEMKYLMTLIKDDTMALFPNVGYPKAVCIYLRGTSFANDRIKAEMSRKGARLSE